MATMTVEQLVSQLRAAYGERLRSVVLYGSAASAEHVAKKSDYNVLVLLDRIENGALAAASAVARAWRESGNPPPMTMTMAEWRSSADVFPMEYSDILERNRVLFGDPPFEGITISRSMLRLQLESQVMGKLLRLRQGALLAGNEAKEQINLMAASFTTIMVLFRGALRLHGELATADNASTAERVAQIAGFDAAPFVRAAGHHRGIAEIPTADAGATLAGYLTGVERLDAHIDAFPTHDSVQ